MRNIAVYTLFDDAYFEYGVTMVYSFFKNNKWFNGDFIIIYDDKLCILSEEHRNEISKISKSIKFLFIESSRYDPIFKNMLSIIGNVNPKMLSCYYKIEIFNNNYDKVIWIDSDCVVRSSLENVFMDESMDGKFCACPDRVVESNSPFPHKKDYSVEYFNGGFYRIDSTFKNNTKYTYDKIYAECTLITKETFVKSERSHDNGICVDQDFFNFYVDDDDVIMLDNKIYNCNPLITKNFDNTKIFHYYWPCKIGYVIDTKGAAPQFFNEWRDYNKRSKFKYSILTFNIGGYEVLHEVEKPSEICEYVYVTDDKSITSKTWTVKYVENEHPDDNFKLCWKIRYNPFDYVSTDIVFKIDGTTTPCGDTDKIYRKFVDGNYDICLFMHPERSTLIEEYPIWEQYRGYPHEQSVKVLNFLYHNEGYDVMNYRGLYQLNWMIQRKNKVNLDILSMTHAFCSYFAPEGKEVDRLDQTIMSFVINKYFPNINVLPVDDNLLLGKYFKMFWHGTNSLIPVHVTDIPKYLFNKEVTPFVFE